jgi:hypothetical protein
MRRPQIRCLGATTGITRVCYPKPAAEAAKFRHQSATAKLLNLVPSIESGGESGIPFPLPAIAPKTPQNKDSRNSPLEICDHRCVPPDRSIRPSTSGDFEAVGGGRLRAGDVSFGRFFGPLRDDGVHQCSIDPIHSVTGQDVPAGFILRLVVRHAPKPDACDIRFPAVDLQVDPPHRAALSGYAWRGHAINKVEACPA